MSGLADGLLGRKLKEAITNASIEYQMCQMAAQKADLVGAPLVAAVFRSVAESHTGKAHVLSRLLLQVDPTSDPNTLSATAELAAAVERNVDYDIVDREIGDAISSLQSQSLRDDIVAALRITATNSQRLKGLLASLTKAEGTGPA